MKTKMLTVLLVLVAVTSSIATLPTCPNARGAELARSYHHDHDHHHDRVCGASSLGDEDPAQWNFNGRDLCGSTSQPGADRLTPRAVALSLHLLWSTAAGSGLGSAVEGSVDVRDGIAYAAAFGDKVLAYRLADGAPLWTTLVGDGEIEGAPALTDRVYVSGGIFAPDQGVAALDRAAGGIIFETPIDGASLFNATSAQVSPIVVEDLLITGTGSCQETCAMPLGDGKYAFTFASGVYAFDRTTGRLVWKFITTGANATDSPGNSIGYSLAADTTRKLVFVGTGNAYALPDSPLSCAVLALDYRTGELVWANKLNDRCIWSIEYPDAASLGATGFPRDFDVGTYPQVSLHPLPPPPPPPPSLPLPYFFFFFFFAPPHGPLTVSFFSSSTNPRPQLFRIKWGHYSYDVLGVTDKSQNYTVMTRDQGCILWRAPLIPVGTQPSLGGTPGAAYQDGVLYTVGLADPNNLVTPAISIAAAFGDYAAIQAVISAYTSGLVTYLHAMSAQNGDIVWTRTFPGVVFSSPSTNGKIVVVGTFSGQLHVLDAATGVDVLPPFSTPPDTVLGLPNQPIVSTASIIEDATGDYIIVGSGFNFLSGGVSVYKL
jgi:outer membrane protein assembly factor BamB